MAFNASNLVVAWNGNGRPFGGQTYQGNSDHPTIWDYDAGSDVLSDIEGGAGYFTPTSAMDTFRCGDLVQVTASDGKALYRVEGLKNTLVNPLGQGNVVLIKLAAVTSFNTDYNIFKG